MIDSKLTNDEHERRALQEYIVNLESIKEKAERLAKENEELKHSQNLLTAILGNAKNGITLIKDRKLSWCNPGFTEILGWSGAESVGMSVAAIYPNEEEYVKMGHVIYSESPQSKLKPFEYDFVHKDGHRVPCLVRGHALDENDLSKGYVFSHTDISTRKRTEKDLLFKKVLLEAQSESSIDGILVVDDEGQVVSTNRRMRELWNVPQEIWGLGNDERLLQHAVTQLKYPDEFLEKVKFLYVHKEEKCRDEIEMKDGRILDRYSAPLIDDSGSYHGRIWYFRDITEHKLTEESLKKTKAEAEAANKAKTDFLANMSHELRTPLNHIIGFSELVVDKQLGELNKIQEEYLNDVLSSGKHLLSLINDILDLSKVEAGKLEFAPSDINPGALLENSLVMVKERAMKHRIQLSTRMGNIPDIMIADERKLKQICYNLLSNAVKFTPDGGKIDVDAEVIDHQWLQNNVPAPFGANLLTVIENKGSEYLKVTVTDNGIGIPAGSLKKIFGQFQQEGISTSKKYGGTGLGLALCKNLLELHKGGIWVESQIEKGSTFSFVIPLTGHADNCRTDPVKTRPESNPFSRRNKPLILIVDDDEKMCRRMSDIFTLEGYDVHTAMNGQSAITSTVETLPDLILLDLMLPKTDGWQVLTQLKADKKTRNIPIIICSVIEDHLMAQYHGACDYLIKPVQRQYLLDCLKKIDFSFCGEHRVNDILLVDDNPRDLKFYADILKREGLTVRLAQSGSQAISMIREQPPALVLLDLLMPDMSGYQVIDIMRNDTSSREIPVIVLTGASLSRAERKKLAADIEGVVEKTPDSLEILLSEMKKFMEL